MSALSNYKPSTLLVDIPDSNIDNKLGVKNLVVPSSRNPPPVTKPRVTIDHWSANNGSVIYAQTNALKNGSRSNENGSNISNHMDANGRQQKESQLSRSHNLIHQNGTTTIVNGGQQQMPTMIPITTNMEFNNRSPQNQDNLIRSLNNISSPTKNHILDIHCNGKSTTAINNHSGEPDLNHSSSTNWSNGTCKTSDLLF